VLHSKRGWTSPICQRQEAIKASSGKYADAFSADLRRDWPK